MTAYEQRRETLGVILISRRVHMVLQQDTIKRERVLGDVAYLQKSLVKWVDDGTPFGQAARKLVECAIAEAANDKRLTEKSP